MLKFKRLTNDEDGFSVGHQTEGVLEEAATQGHHGSYSGDFFHELLGGAEQRALRVADLVVQVGLAEREHGNQRRP